MFYLAGTVGASCPPVKKKKCRCASLSCVVKDPGHEQKGVEPEMLGKVGRFGRELGRAG